MIGGKLTLDALARLHRPADPESLAAEARRLRDSGLLPDDIGAALGLSRQVVRTLLAERQEAA